MSVGLYVLLVSFLTIKNPGPDGAAGFGNSILEMWSQVELEIFTVQLGMSPTLPLNFTGGQKLPNITPILTPVASHAVF